MRSTLSVSASETGRRRYVRFTRLNALSFGCLADSMLILYAIKNGADDYLVGVLTSFFYLTMPFMFLGKKLVGTYGASRSYAISWALRNTSAAIMIGVPFLTNRFGSKYGLGLLMLGAFGFFAFRSAGLTANTPILGEITSKSNRGSYISRVWIHFNLFYFMAVSTLIVILHRSDTVETYQKIIAFGAVTGWISAFLINRVPESKNTRISGKEPTGKALSYIWNEDRRIRKLLFAWIAAVVMVMLVTPFTMVALKNGYRVSDYNALFYALLQIVGAVVASLVNSLVLDRVGPRPMLILYTFGLIVCAAMWMLAPQSFLIYFPAIIFLLIGICRAGSMTTLNHYFLSIVPQDKRVASNMLIYIISGVFAGLSGTFIGGGMLKLLATMNINGLDTYRIYFSSILIILIPMWFVVRRLRPVADWKIKDVLGVFVSFREIRALFTLQRLDKELNVAQEYHGVEKLREIPSELSERRLIAFLDSPRFTVRGRALGALGQINFSQEAARKIMNEVQQGEYTTAYIAAEILGEHGIMEAIPVLRDALESEDIYLLGKSMLSLAMLKDKSSYKRIENIFNRSENPRLVIHGARAIAEMKNVKRLNLMLRKTVNRHMPVKVREELLYCICELCDCGEEFYRFLYAKQEDYEHGVYTFRAILRLYSKRSTGDMSRFVENVKLLEHAGENSDRLIKFFREYVSDRKSTISKIAREFINSNSIDKIQTDLIFCLYLILAREAID
ncbi:MFS transporter [candidate division KSB1 bacterium]|nr:MFS transporter [candidate division KSB1 bacterium]